MRSFLFCFAALLLGAFSIGAQSDSSDPYSIEVVHSAFGTAMTAPGARVSFIEKRIVTLGDAVSISLMKFLNENDLKEPKGVAAALDVIRMGFSDPKKIAIAIDAQPRVTLCLLDSLKRKTSDARLQADIEQTIDFVKNASRQRN